MVLEQRQSLLSVTVSDAAPVTRAVTDGFGGDLDPSSDPTGARMVFSSTRAGHRNLWTARPGWQRFASVDVRYRKRSSPGILTRRAADSLRVRSGRAVGHLVDQRCRRCRPAADTGNRSRLAGVVANGTEILYATPGSDKPTVLASVSVADGKTRTFQTPAAPMAPSSSPTSDTIAYLEPTMAKPDSSSVPVLRYSLRFVDGNGRPRASRRFAQQHLPNAIVAWAPDGRRLAVTTVPANAPAAIWIVELDARTPFRKLIELSPPFVPGASPGRRTVLSSSSQVRSRSAISFFTRSGADATALHEAQSTLGHKKASTTGPPRVVPPRLHDVAHPDRRASRPRATRSTTLVCAGELVKVSGR